MAREVISPAPLKPPRMGLKLIQLWARSLHSIHAIRAVNFCTDAGFDEVLMQSQGHPWGSNNPDQPSLAMQRARISPRHLLQGRDLPWKHGLHHSDCNWLLAVKHPSPLGASAQRFPGEKRGSGATKSSQNQ